MTLKKSKKGQAIFEYFVLTTVVVTVVLFFATTPYFKNMKDSCESAFNKGISKIAGIEEGDKTGETLK